MSILLVTAAVLISLLGIAHSYLGERYLLVRLFRREDLPTLFGDQSFTRHTLRFAWHLTTVAWLGLAGVLATLEPSSSEGGRSSGRVVAATFAVSGLVSLVGSRGRHLSWAVFFVVAGLVWLACR